MKRRSFLSSVAAAAAAFGITVPESFGTTVVPGPPVFKAPNERDIEPIAHVVAVSHGFTDTRGVKTIFVEVSNDFLCAGAIVRLDIDSTQEYVVHYVTIITDESTEPKLKQYWVTLSAVSWNGETRIDPADFPVGAPLYYHGSALLEPLHRTR